MYQPLNHHLREIRLLTILPGKKDSRIKAKLTTYTLPSDASVPGKPRQGQSTAPEYDALSYEWGDPNGTKHSILLEGEPFEVRKKLFQALKMLRALFKGIRPLWIDAICIDQKDVQERNHKVRMMSHIYKSAEWVRVWLGAWTNGDGDAFKLMAKILDAVDGFYGFRYLRYPVYELFKPFSTWRVYNDEKVQSEWEKLHAAVDKSPELGNIGGW
jgi:hypothetical protein